MTDVSPSALEKLQELIQRGLITEGRQGRQLKMPSAYRWAPNVTSSGTASISEGIADAQLDSGSQGNREGTT